MVLWGASDGDSVSIETKQVSEEQNPGADIHLDRTDFLLSADFNRLGSDLEIVGKDGHSIIVENYFVSEVPADIYAPSGAVLTGEVVSRLAGPENPGVYAQQGAATGQAPIGQVEALEGTATVQRADGTVETLTIGSPVFENDVVQTGEGSSLSLTFADGTIFALTENARMILDSLVYSPEGENNSAVFNLVEGSFVFIAGQVAKTGDMKVETPVSTLGIRGTTVYVDVQLTEDGGVVTARLTRDINGDLGSFTILDKAGNVLAEVDTEASTWVVNPGTDQAQEVPTSSTDQITDQQIISQVFDAYNSAVNRVTNGESLVDGAVATADEAVVEGAPADGEDSADDEATDSEDADSTDSESESTEPTSTDGDQSDAGSTAPEPSVEFSSLAESTDTSDTGDTGDVSVDSVGSPDSSSDGGLTTDDVGGETGGETGGGGDQPNPVVTEDPPEITIPGTTQTANEDGSVVVSGISIAGNNDTETLDVTLVAGSHIVLVPGSGVVIGANVPGPIPNSYESVEISGTPTQLTNALNGLTYYPSADDDDGGTLTITASNSDGSDTSVIGVDITPQNDDPTAVDDNISRGENSNLFQGDVTLNDIDPDTQPTPDTLTVLGVTDTTNSPTAVTLGVPYTTSGGGTLTIFGSGSYTFEPNGAYESLTTGQSVVETFEYELTDGNGGLTDTAVLTITVTGTNDAPTTSITSGSGAEDGGVIAVALSGSDVDGTVASFEIKSLPANGTLYADAGMTTMLSVGDTVAAAGNAATVYFNPDPNFSGSPTFTYASIDNLGLEDPTPATATITVSAVNDAPVVNLDFDNSSGSTGSGYLNTFTEDGGPVLLSDAIQSDVTISDVDDTIIESVTITLTNPLDDPSNTGVEGLVNTGILSPNITASAYDPVTGQIVLSGSETVSFYEQAIEAIRYFNDSDNPTETDRTITVVVNDGDDDSNVATATISVVAANDPPVVSAVTDPAAVTEGDQGLPVTLETVDLNTLLTFSDPDNGDTPFIDPDSIVITAQAGSAVQTILPLNVNGTVITYDTSVFDLLDTGQSAIYDVSFNVVSGPDTVARTAVITIDGVTDNTINIVSGTTGADGTLNGTAGNDIVDGQGNNGVNFGEDVLNGLDGDDILLGSDGNEVFDGGDGDDTIFTGDNNGSQGDFTIGSLGNDRINFSGNVNGFQGIQYSNFLTATAIIATIDVNGIVANANTIQKDEIGTGIIGTDTLVDAHKPILSGGLSIYGTNEDDTFNITSSTSGFVGVTAGDGVDTYNLYGGLIRLEFRTDGAFSPATQAANVNLSTGQIINDGFGNMETINLLGDFSSGTGNKIELRGTDFNDTLIGDAGDNRFIGEQGSDFIDGMGGIDLIRFDRSGAVSVEVDLSINEGVINPIVNAVVNAEGYWDNTLFDYRLVNIENIRGSNVGVDILFGSSGANEIDGRRGIDIIDGAGGNDILTGGSDVDILRFQASSGQDIITDLDTALDRVVILDRGFTSAADFTITFDGTNSIADLGGGDTITFEGIDLTALSTAQLDEFFVFNQQVGTSGNDILNGTASNDVLLGEDGDDQLNGGDGNDILIGGGASDGYNSGGDVLDGGAGDDVLIGQEGFTTFIGGPGDDRIAASRVVYVNDELSFQDFNYLDYSSSPGPITANLTGGMQAGLAPGTVSDGFGGIDTVSGITRIFDTDGNDVIYVDGSSASTTGGRGPGVSLSGGDDQVIFLGNGGRIIFQRATEGVNVDLAAGTATDLDLENGNQLGNDTFTTNVTQAHGSNYDDVIVGNSLNNRFRGRGGDDLIDGGSGGFNSVDHFSSLRRVVVDFNQTSNGIPLADGTGLVLSDGTGFQYNLMPSSNDLFYQIFRNSGSDNLINIQGVSGNFAPDWIEGDALDNNFSGYANNDVLIGGGGNDNLFGDFGDVGQGNGDVAAGGNDYLVGGLGFDYLEGGTDADIFVYNAGEDTDTIGDLNYFEGDKIDISSYGYTSTADFNGPLTTGGGQIFFDSVSNQTWIDFDGGGDDIYVNGVDLLTQLTPAELEDLFLFSVLEATNDFGDGGFGFFETAGDDYFRALSSFDPVSNPFPYTFLNASAGNDTIDLSLSYQDFHILNYAGWANGITVDINGFANTGSIDKGTGETDTIFNVNTALDAGYYSGSGGLDIRGTAFNDVFNINTPSETWMVIRGNAGNDTINLINEDSGLVRLDYRSSTSGIQVDLSLASGQIIDDGLGGTDTITGAGIGVNGTGIWEIRATSFNDILTGSDKSESFRPGLGSDTIDGGDGFDRVRYDEGALEAGLTITLNEPVMAGDPTTGTVTYVDPTTAVDDSFTDTLTSIEWIRGSDFADTFTGTSQDERFEGKDGNDVINGGGGADIILGDGGDDTIGILDANFLHIDGGFGQDTLSFLGSSMNIDFTNVENIESIESVDMGSSSNTATITADNVIGASDEKNQAIDTALVDGANGGGDGFDAILIDGDATDTLNLSNTSDYAGASWVLDAVDSAAFVGYNVYDFTNGTDTFAQVAVDDTIIQVNIVA